MKGVYHPAFVQEAALKARDYWAERLEQERAAYIASEAAKVIPGRWRRPPTVVGEAEAADRWDRQTYYGGRAGGYYTAPYEPLQAAKRLVRLTANEGADSVILEAAEIACLNPVLEAKQEEASA